MSLFEILVILVVSILVMKPEDLPKLIKTIKTIQTSLHQAKNAFFAYFESKEIDLVADQELTQLSQLNFYLEKIASLGAEYSGEYQLESVKEYYRKLVNKKLSQELTAPKLDE